MPIEILPKWTIIIWLRRSSWVNMTSQHKSKGFTLINKLFVIIIFWICCSRRLHNARGEGRVRCGAVPGECSFDCGWFESSLWVAGRPHRLQTCGNAIRRACDSHNRRVLQYVQLIPLRIPQWIFPWTCSERSTLICLVPQIEWNQTQ